jgi:hypothetical protein
MKVGLNLGGWLRLGWSVVSLVKSGMGLCSGFIQKQAVMLAVRITVAYPWPLFGPRKSTWAGSKSTLLGLDFKNNCTPPSYASSFVGKLLQKLVQNQHDFLWLTLGWWAKCQLLEAHNYYQLTTACWQTVTKTEKMTLSFNLQHSYFRFWSATILLGSRFWRAGASRQTLGISSQ